MFTKEKLGSPKVKKNKCNDCCITRLIFKNNIQSLWGFFFIPDLNNGLPGFFFCVGALAANQFVFSLFFIYREYTSPRNWKLGQFLYCNFYNTLQRKYWHKDVFSIKS